MEQLQQPSQPLRYSGAKDLTEWLATMNGGEPPVIFPFQPAKDCVLVWLCYNQQSQELEFGAVESVQLIEEVPIGTIWFCHIPRSTFAHAVEY